MLRAAQVDAVDFNILMRLARSLADENVAYVLVGGVAVNLQGIGRATRDIDLFVAPDVENVERLKRAMGRVWKDPSIDSINADELVGDYPAVRYGPPEGDLGIDIMTRLGEAFHYADLQSETIMYQGVPVQVATPLTLYRMKRDTVRFQDRADAEALKDRFGLEE